jgi:putative transposase
VARRTTANFVLELPLRTTAADAGALGVQLDAARQVYNAVVGESLRRLDLMRERREYIAARRIPRGASRSPERKARAEEFRRLWEEFGLTAGSLQKFAQTCRGSRWIKDHLPGPACQTAATRAFHAVLQYGFGKRGRLRFKCRERHNSFEGKEAKSTIIWRDGAVRLCGVVVPAILNPANTWQTEALKAKAKYCRIIRREIRGRYPSYVQLIQKGLTPLVRETKRGVVGLDIGPGNIGAVAQTEAVFEQFRPSAIQPWEELRHIERAMDRSKRANNPECFDEKGRSKKGARMRVRSKRYRVLARKRRERERCLAAERKRCGALANRILGQGATVKTEKLSYRAWQRQRYGKSIKLRAAGAFVRMLERKATAVAGGELIEFGTRYTSLSQFCHVDGTYTKKPLSQRYHQFPDGSRVGRDLYAAFLARYVLDNRLDAIQAARAWTGAQSFLRAASDGFEPASGKGFALHHVTPGVRAGRSKNCAQKGREAGDVVALAALPVARVSENGAKVASPDD